MAVKRDFHRIYGCENGFSQFMAVKMDFHHSKIVVKIGFHRLL
jgi:hypothetical protein